MSPARGLRSNVTTAKQIERPTGSQVLLGLDAAGLMKATATCWIARIGTSALGMEVDIQQCLVNKRLEKRALPTVKAKRLISSAITLIVKTSN